MRPPRPADPPRAPRLARVVLIGAGAALGLWSLFTGIHLWVLVTGIQPPGPVIVRFERAEEMLNRDAWLLALLIPSALSLLALGVAGFRTHDSHRGRTAASLVHDLPRWAATTGPGRALLFILAIFVGVGGPNWDFWVTSAHAIAAVVLLAGSLAGGWIVVLGAFALNTRNTPQELPSRPSSPAS